MFDVNSSLYNFRQAIFRTHRDGLNRVMTSSVTVMTPSVNIYRILLDGKPLDATWNIVGGEQSRQNMAFTKVQVTDGTHYLATANLESAFTAWLTMVPAVGRNRDTSSMSLGNAGKYFLNIFLIWVLISRLHSVAVNII